MLTINEKLENLQGSMPILLPQKCKNCWPLHFKFDVYVLALGYSIKTKFLLDNSLIYLLGGGYEIYSPREFNMIGWFECTVVKNYILL